MTVTPVIQEPVSITPALARRIEIWSVDRVVPYAKNARTHSPELGTLLGKGLPGLQGRDGAAVWGQEFLFAVESDAPAFVSIDKQPPVAMRQAAGRKYWYKLAVLRLGTTHQYVYTAGGRTLGAYEVAGYNPDSYPREGVARGTLSERRTLESKVYPGMKASYWVYVNAGADVRRGAPSGLRLRSNYTRVIQPPCPPPATARAPSSSSSASATVSSTTGPGRG